jgi:hypothetical protein
MNSGFLPQAGRAFVAVLILTAALPLYAQENTPQQEVIRVGVPLMQNVSDRSVNRRLQRDWLVRAFEPDKKKARKKKQDPGPRIEAVPLDADKPAEALREARDKQCRYVLYTSLVELRTPGDPPPRNQPPGSVSIGRDSLSVYPDPTVMHDPVYRAVVDYRLFKLGVFQPVIALSASTEEHSDENGAVARVLGLIANRVTKEIASAADPSIR